MERAKGNHIHMDFVYLVFACAAITLVLLKKVMYVYGAMKMSTTSMAINSVCCLALVLYSVANATHISFHSALCFGVHFTFFCFCFYLLFLIPATSDAP